MPPTYKEWIVPGILISLVSALLSVGGSYAVNNYRIGEAENKIADNQAKTEKRIDKLQDQIERIGQGGIEMARLQEQNRALVQQINKIEDQMREIDGKTDARYDNLSTRLARQGF